MRDILAALACHHRDQDRHVVLLRNRTGVPRSFGWERLGALPISGVGKSRNLGTQAVSETGWRLIPGVRYGLVLERIIGGPGAEEIE